MIKGLSICTCVWLGLAVAARAAVLGVYPFTSGTAATSLGANVASFSAFNNNGAGGVGGSVSGGAYTTTKSWDVTFTKYVQFTITPASGYYLSIDSVNLLARQNDRNSITHMLVEIFSGATLLQTAAVDLAPAAGSNPYQSLNFTFTPARNPNGALDFRIFAQVNDAGNNYLEFDSDTVNGLAIIPEPVPMALGLFGAVAAVAWLGGGWLRRSRRKLGGTVRHGSLGTDVKRVR